MGGVVDWGTHDSLTVRLLEECKSTGAAIKLLDSRATGTRLMLWALLKSFISRI